MTELNVGDLVEIRTLDGKRYTPSFVENWEGTRGRITEDVPGVLNFAPEKFVAVQPIGDRPDEGGSSPFYWPKDELRKISEKENTAMTFATDANETLTLWVKEIDNKIAQYQTGEYDYRKATAVATLRDWRGQVTRAQELLVENAPELRPDPFVTEVNDILDEFDAAIADAAVELADAFAGDVRLTAVVKKAAEWRDEILKARALVG